jgi:alpha-tubulin suppressor-like RCC1 family protein/chitodextrinase
VTVSGVTGVSAICAGDTHALALKSDGTVRAWGLNTSGQLGDASVINRSTSVQVGSVTTAVALSAGTNHSHVILSDARILSYGGNANGQFGDGLRNPIRLTAVQPTSWTDVTAFAAGASHTLAVRAPGTAWAWGLNANGQLGDGSTTQRTLPVQITTLSAVSKVAAGAFHSLALHTDGTVRAWGLNSSGQLGDASTTQRTAPVTLSTPTGITTIAAGDNHSLALKSNGTVWVWGLNTNGQLGDGLTANRSTPFQLTTLTAVSAIAAGNSHSLAVKTDGTLYAWGLNSSGQLGDNSTTQRTAPVQVLGTGGTGFLTGVVAAASAGTHSLALKTDGTLWAWGKNTNGQLGDNSTTQRNAPVQVKGPGGTGFLTGVIAVAAGETYSLAVLSDGTVRAWGLNSSAQLGNGTLVQSTTPVIVSGLTAAAIVAAGDSHSLALRTDQTLRVWGSHANGQLGAPVLVASAVALSLKTNAGDSDADGLPDAWETTHWGNFTQSGSSDPDADGLTNVQEYILGTNPTQPDVDLDLLTDPVDLHPSDYYNSLVPTIVILGGNTQTTPAGQFNPLGFDVAVWNSAGTAPLVNAPVTFSVLSGGGQMAASATPPLFFTLVRRTDVDGSIDAFYKQPGSSGVSSQIRASAGTAQVTFDTTSTNADLQAPTVPSGLAASALTPTSFTLTWTAATDNFTAQSAIIYEVFLGGVSRGTTAAGVTTFSVTGLTPSTGYSVTVRARDAADTPNNSAQSAALAVTTTADTTAPSVPDGLVASAITPTSFTLTWTASTDNVTAQSALRYDVYRGGTLLGTTAAGVATYSVTGLAPSTAYSMAVRARDTAVTPNNSAQSSALAVTTPADTTAPSVPAGLAASAITATSFTLTWSASTDNVTAQSALVYEVFRAGVSRGTTAPGVTSLAITGLAPSTANSMTVRVRDTAASPNNSAQSSPLVVTTTADTTPPSVPGGLASSARTTTSFTLSWTASTDNVSAQSTLVYEVFLGGVSRGTTAAGVTSRSITGLAPSTGYSMTVRARDTATTPNYSSQSTALVVTTTADTTAPTVPGALVRTARTATSLSLSWTASTDNIAVASYELYDGTTLLATIPAPATSYTANELTPSTGYNLKLRAKDAAGNSSAYNSVLLAYTIGSGIPATVPGLRLWLKADAASVGTLALWRDQSGLDNHGTQPNSSAYPQVVLNAMNGKAVVRFDGTDDYMELPNLMAGAIEGEIFIVNRLENFTNSYNGLCQFGVQNGVSYSQDNGDLIWEDFGINDPNPFSGPGSAVLTSTHIYNSSITTNSVSSVRFDGRKLMIRTGSQVDFNNAPLLGNDYYNEPYRGDIAEVIVYDRALSQSERNALYTYLSAKYAPPGIVLPSTPELTGFAASSTQADIAWTVTSGADQHLVATLERQSGAEAFTVIANLDDTFNYTDSDLSPATTYSYRVKLTSYAGTSAYSNAVTITTLANNGSIPTTGLRLWLRSTAGLPVSGPASAWGDQSTLNNDAVQLDENRRPQVIPNAINGRPAVRFDGEGDALNLPDLMAGATAGEIIAVLKVGDKTPGLYSNNNNDLWNFGLSTGYYYDTPGFPTYYRYNGFGLDGSHESGNFPKALVSDYHIHDTSSTAAVSIERYNGQTYSTLVNPTVAFSNPNPWLGNGFVGDFAEILIYDRALTPEERDTLHTYLAAKYAPPGIVVPATPSLNAYAATGTKIDLRWSLASATAQHLGSTIERKVGSGAFAPLITLSDTYAYTDSGLTPGETYTYRVKLTSYAGASTFSDPVTITTLLNAPELPADGLRIWLRSTIGPRGPGPVTGWLDQSGQFNDAVQLNNPECPEQVENAVNGFPVIRFNGNQRLDLPAAMAGATAGEIIAVLKVVPKPDFVWNYAWRFGAVYSSGYYSSSYYGLLHFENFGLNEASNTSHPASSLATAYHFEGASIGAGVQAGRINGALDWQRTGASFGFTTTPNLGANSFTGDMAEVIVYDRVLSQAERDAVYTYLTAKYTPPDITVPTKPVIAVSAISPTQAQISWDDQSQGGKLHVYVTVERSTAGGAYEIIATLNGVNSYLDTGGIPSVLHTYRIKMTSYAGKSPYSDTVSLVMSPGNADIDGDGLANSYEIANGLNPRVNDGEGDLDLDGVPNNQDSRPNSAAFGRIQISILTPLNGSVLP